MDGFYGRFLKINLTDNHFDVVTLTEEILLKYLGGKGLASYLLYSINPPGVDPLSPDNCLIFATGPITKPGYGVQAGMASLPNPPRPVFFLNRMPAEKYRKLSIQQGMMPL